MNDVKENDYYLLDKYPPLRIYAFIGLNEQFIAKLKYLATLAEPENWYYANPNRERDEAYDSVAVLYQYIMHTFSKAQDDNKIVESDTHAIFNTGLLTVNGEEIYMLFEMNERETPKWYLSNFLKESAHEIPQDLRNKLPDHVDYFAQNNEAAYFDSSLPIIGSFDHIVNDNFERLPEVLKTLPHNMVSDYLNGSIEVMRKRILRNNRLVVPQYYNKKITYLVPLKIGDETIPLALERHDSTYRINTILTNGMAYCNARLVMKQESDWLLNKRK